MASFVETTVAKIDEHLGEVRAELARLEAARDALRALQYETAKPRPSARRGTAASNKATHGPRRRPGRPPGGGDVSRSEQVVRLLSSRPGLSASQVAQDLGTNKTYLYRVMPRLADEGKIRRQGSVWFALDAGSDAAAAVG